MRTGWSTYSGATYWPAWSWNAWLANRTASAMASLAIRCRHSSTLRRERFAQVFVDLYRGRQCITNILQGLLRRIAFRYHLWEDRTGNCKTTLRLGREHQRHLDKVRHTPIVPKKPRNAAAPIERCSGDVTTKNKGHEVPKATRRPASGKPIKSPRAPAGAPSTNSSSGSDCRSRPDTNSRSRRWPFRGCAPGHRPVPDRAGYRSCRCCWRAGPNA